MMVLAGNILSAIGLHLNSSPVKYDDEVTSKIANVLAEINPKLKECPALTDSKVTKMPAQLSASLHTDIECAKVHLECLECIKVAAFKVNDMAEVYYKQCYDTESKALALAQISSELKGKGHKSRVDQAKTALEDASNKTREAIHENEKAEEKLDLITTEMEGLKAKLEDLQKQLAQTEPPAKKQRSSNELNRVSLG
jgi:chromosome segregation ATPase